MDSLVPWVPEAFHARFPVSVKSLKKWPARKVFARGFAARLFDLRPKTCRRPTKLLVKREKKPLVPRVTHLVNLFFQTTEMANADLEKYYKALDG